MISIMLIRIIINNDFLMKKFTFCMSLLSCYKIWITQNQINICIRIANIFLQVDLGIISKLLFSLWINKLTANYLL